MEVLFVTKEEVLFRGRAEYVRVPGEMGSLGILSNHAPLLSPLKKGKVLINKDEFFINGGFVKVSDNYIIILGE